MLDLTKYEYINIGLPNIKVKWERLYDHGRVTFSIDRNLEGFMFEAAKKYPMWDFIAKGKGGRQNVDMGKCTAQGFYVYDGDELLGEIDFQFSSNGDVVYVIENERIKDERQRGSAAKTKDMNKAIKILGKKFGAKTLSERLEIADTACTSGLYDVQSHKTAKFLNAYGALTSHLHEYLMSNWDTVKEIAISKGEKPETLEKIPEIYDAHVETKKIRNHHTNDKGVIVVIHGADYAVRELGKGGDNVTIYSTNDLPDWIKRGVGMLKLVEKDHLISNVGYKIDNASFFVMKGDE